MAVSKQVDVLIVGAGISGIDAAYRLKTRCPGKSLAILEAPGPHRRHLGPVPLSRRALRLRHVHAWLPVPPLAVGSRRSSEGPAIRDYVEDTAREFGIFDHIRFGHRVTSASWSSKEAALDCRSRARGNASNTLAPSCSSAQRLLRLRAGATGPNGPARQSSRAASSTRNSGLTI